MLNHCEPFVSPSFIRPAGIRLNVRQPTESAIVRDHGDPGFKTVNAMISSGCKSLLAFTPVSVDRNDARIRIGIHSSPDATHGKGGKR